MFTKLLIANRGEIACRVMRTARRMGIRTVAVFSEADAKALHVEMADEAVPIGPPPARESYLRIDRIIAAAKATGAEAIHPGYGFLSENPLFAEACAEAGIVFVGPPASAMRAMGSKAEAKRLMQAAGVPLVPGYHGEDQSDALLAGEAARIGYPVLIKASAGGGGRGMRAVDTASDFATQLAAARREAEAAFGDGRVLLEKYLTNPRHIEVQLLGDQHGTLLHFGTRDCSIQRRHQKIIEEAPAPGLSDATRRKMHEAALAAGRSVKYTNAGTVEFIVGAGTGPTYLHTDPPFYFMEMNTRLQVEHPVTERVYGVDLVEQQLRVAAGERLGLTQRDVDARASGHAIEVRLCAEDPDQDFRPTAGAFDLHWRQGPDSAERIDWGYRMGYGGNSISSDYDNLIAKIIVSGHSRDDARQQLVDKLGSAHVKMLTTNLGLLLRIAKHPAFANAELDTGFLVRHRMTLLQTKGLPPPPLWAAAAFVRLREARVPPILGWMRDYGRGFFLDPWYELQGFRQYGCGQATVGLRAEGVVRQVKVHIDGERMWVTPAQGSTIAAEVRWSDWNVTLEFDGKQTCVRVHGSGEQIELALAGDQTAYRFQVLDPYAPPGADAAGADRIAAPIPGTVLRVDVSAGDVVARGKVLVVMEAMKTELRLAAPADGTVARVLVKPGDMVQEGMELVQMTHEEAKG
jgi:3-methylcrotonyl-CoA carboxylase alpha subunit